ncbi:MAG: glutamate mutase L [Anaerolineaceae bacterium]|nr:glutamate mutase L [Anaerolineaceae bacterium]
MSVNRSDSILAVDFGNVLTRAVLIDLVDGVYRLVAHGESQTTNGYPANDIQFGMNRALQAITDVTARRLLDEHNRLILPEQEDRSGVDHLVVTASTGRSLRTVIVGLVPDISVASAIRATAGTYVEVVDVVTLADGRDDEGRLNATLLGRPDLIFIVGGTEDGAEASVLELAQGVRQALSVLAQAQRPAILFAGNMALQSKIEALFEDFAQLFVAPNVRPSVDVESIEGAQARLAEVFDAHQSLGGGGFERIGEISRIGIQPTAQSYALLAGYLGDTDGGKGALLLDVGSAISTMSAGLNGTVTTTIRTDIGLGHSALSLLNHLGEEAIARWLPFYPAPDEILEYALNKTLRPDTIPQTLRERYLEHALLCAGTQAMIANAIPTWRQTVIAGGDLPPFSTIMSAGAGFTRTGSAGMAALLLLDATQPTGVTHLLTDPYGLLAALGAVARVSPTVAVQVLDTGSLESVGTCFCVSGHPVPERAVMKVKITLQGGEVVKHTVSGGHLWAYPLPTGHQAVVEVRVTGRDTHIDGQKRVKIIVTGGHVGLIFDGRGRPLPLALAPAERAAQMPLWLSELTGILAAEIDPSWLVAPEAPQEAAAPAKPKAEKKPRKEKKPKAPKKSRRGKREGEPVIDLDDEADESFDISDLDDDESDSIFSELDELRR